MKSRLTGGQHAHELLGRRFVADFTVIRLCGSPDGDPEAAERLVVVQMHGDRFEISLGELKQLVQTGFVVEA